MDHYLVHEHQSPLMTIVGFLIGWFSDAFPFNLFPPLSQVIIPQLIAENREKVKA